MILASGESCTPYENLLVGYRYEINKGHGHNSSFYLGLNIQLEYSNKENLAGAEFPLRQRVHIFPPSLKKLMAFEFPAPDTRYTIATVSLLLIALILLIALKTMV